MPYNVLAVGATYTGKKKMKKIKPAMYIQPFCFALGI